MISTEDAIEDEALTLAALGFEARDRLPDLRMANLRKLGNGSAVGTDRGGGAIPPDLFRAVSLYLAVSFF